MTGSWSPSAALGCGAARAIAAKSENVEAFARAEDPDIDITIERLMLTWEQAREPAFIHPSGREPVRRSGKGVNWPEGWGWMAQMEGVDQMVVRDTVRDRLSELLDVGIRDAALEASDEARSSLLADLGFEEE
jgi:hypothetical protein